MCIYAFSCNKSTQLRYTTRFGSRGLPEITRAGGGVVNCSTGGQPPYSPPPSTRTLTQPVRSTRVYFNAVVHAEVRELESSYVQFIHAAYKA